MSRPSNVSRVLRGDENVKLNPKQEREALEGFMEMLEEPAANYEQPYKLWRRTRAQANKGKISKDSEVYLNAQQTAKDARAPLHAVLKPLLNLVKAISDENKEEAMNVLKVLKKKPHVVQALVSVPYWNKIKKEIA